MSHTVNLIEALWKFPPGTVKRIVLANSIYDELMDERGIPPLARPANLLMFRDTIVERETPYE